MSRYAALGELTTAYIGTYCLSVAVIAYELSGDVTRACQAALVGTLLKVAWNCYANRLMWQQIRGRARRPLDRPVTSSHPKLSTGGLDHVRSID